MELEFSLNLPPQVVYGYLTDMQKFASVHPIIQKIVPQPGGSYKVYERMKVGFLPYSFTYRATVAGNPDAMQVVINATVMGLTHIQMTFDIGASGANTLVRERITFKSPFPIQSIMQKVFREQHAILFKNIEQAG